MTRRAAPQWQPKRRRPCFGDDARRLYVEHELLWVDGQAGAPWTMDADFKFWTYETGQDDEWWWVRADEYYWRRYHPRMTKHLFGDFRQEWIADWMSRLTALAADAATTRRVTGVRRRCRKHRR